MSRALLPRPIVMVIVLALALSSLLSFQDGGTGPSGLAAAQESEVEPNSDMGLAQEVQSGTFYQGALDDTADPDDWYKIFVPRGKLLNATVHMDGPGLNADLELYYPYVASQMERKWSLTDYEYETITILSVDDQYYHMRVFVRSGSGTYTFQTEINEAPVLGDGDTASGALFNNSYDVIDFYRVWLENRGEDADLLEVHLTKSPIPPAERAWINLRLLRLYDWNVGHRWYDISWGGEDQEHARATASETGWYFIRVNAYNGSGNYELDVTISSTTTDGNDRVSDAPVLYGSGTTARGSLHQAFDHRDCYSVFLTQGEALDVRADLAFPIAEPAIFSITILKPDLTPVGEWTNYNDGALDDLIEASIPSAIMEGRYDIIIEVKVAVLPSAHSDLSDEDGMGNYTLTITPSGHNHGPVPVDLPSGIEIQEDGNVSLDLAPYFHDQDLGEGDRLSYGLDEVGTYSGPGTEGWPLDLTTNASMVLIEPLADWSGSGWVRFVARDLFGSICMQTFSFDVARVNDRPTASEEVITIEIPEGAEERPVDLDDMFTDPDLPYGDHLTYALSGVDQVPAWIDSEGRLVLGPVMGMGQEDAMTITATDIEGSSATIQVVVKVDRVDHPPVTSETSRILRLDEDTSTTIPLYDVFSDPDPEDTRLSFVWSGNRNIHALLNDEGVLTLTPVADWYGTENITVTAMDHTGLTARSVLVMMVDPVGDTPVIEGATPSLGTSLELDGEGYLWVVVNISDIDVEDSHFYRWYIDGDVIPGVTNQPVLALDEEALSNGNHTLSLVVIDIYGLRAEGSWELVVDRPGPEPVMVGPTRTETTVVGSMGFGLWLFFLAFATEPGRFTIFKYLWVPLYTKITKEKVLDQFIRGRIFGFIEHNPGVNYTQIKRKMAVGNGTLTHHLNMLERQNYIKAERDGIYKRFYPKDYSIDEDTIELRGIQGDIFFLVKTRPGISQKEVAKELAVSKRVMSYHVRLMAEARFLKVEKKGSRNSLFVREE